MNFFLTALETTVTQQEDALTMNSSSRDNEIDAQFMSKDDDLSKLLDGFVGHTDDRQSSFSEQSGAKSLSSQSPQQPSSSGICGLFPKDVICARTHEASHHPGNVSYRAQILKHQGIYNQSKSREQKSNITRSIIRQVKCGGGRFVKFEENECTWQEVDDGAVHAKVAHALRSCKEVSRKRRSVKHRQSQIAFTKERRLPSMISDQSFSSMRSCCPDMAHAPEIHPNTNYRKECSLLKERIEPIDFDAQVVLDDLIDWALEDQIMGSLSFVNIFADE